MPRRKAPPAASYSKNSCKCLKISIHNKVLWALQHISKLIFSQTECLIMLIFAVLVVCNEYLEDLVLINLSYMTMTLKIQLKITKIQIGQFSIIGCLHRLSMCHFNINIDFKLIIANHVPFLFYFKLHIIFKVISIWFHVCNSFCASIKHYHLNLSAWQITSSFSVNFLQSNWIHSQKKYKPRFLRWHHLSITIQ